ncbi:unannotated protein [freshwater metagenome]|uniref:Unannotated protein n=1 Tax=freshwater metagenome TaxID=449393 RepID=A0A6J7TTG6_9ZZZZ
MSGSQHALGQRVENKSIVRTVFLRYGQTVRTQTDIPDPGGLHA